jgi:hypothetical protein
LFINTVQLSDDDDMIALDDDGNLIVDDWKDHCGLIEIDLLD